MAKETSKGGKKEKRPKTSPPRTGWQFAGRTAKYALIAAVWLALGLVGVAAWYGWDLPDISRLETPGRRPSVTLVAENGAVLARYGQSHGGPIAFDDLPPHLIQAVVATEDRRFFDHAGFDPWAVARAMIANLRSGSVRQGGSTLTQQLAKNLFLSPERTIRRKVQELLAAFWLEARFSKQQIFAIYANRVYLGSATYGMEAAARRYFGKSVRDVTLAEAAVLAGLLKAPSRYSPLNNPKAATARAKIVLGAMEGAGFLTAREAKRAARRPPRYRHRLGPAPRYFADWVLDRARGFVGGGGRDLIVVTTMEPRLQKAAKRRLAEAVKREGKRGRASQAALVALAPDGAVRALVGGIDYGTSQFNRATQARRQPGSAFKLFVYLAGLEAGIGPNERIIDEPITVDGWWPRNYDGKFRGKITVKRALAKSLNTVAVKISERAGRANVIAAARRLGITSPLKSHPSLALGASEVSLLELTAAYGALTNRGRAVWPYGILEIRDSAGDVLYRREGSGGGAVIAPRHVTALNDMLRGVIASGTGRNARIGRPAAGKTGTSQDSRDAWFIGYTADLVAGVWVGNDDDRPMRRVTGGGMPARLWRSFMRDALKGRPARRLPVAGQRLREPGREAGHEEGGSLPR